MGNFFLAPVVLLAVLVAGGCIDTSKDSKDLSSASARGVQDAPTQSTLPSQQTTSAGEAPDVSSRPTPPSRETTSVSAQPVPSPESNEKSKSSSTGGSPGEFAGSWRAYSERIYYDRGGAGALLSIAKGNAITRTLKISSDGRWEFGDSKGTWTVSAITDEDWSRWGISPYGPTRKVVLDGWNKASADGPAEESTRVDFIWVIYHVEPPLVQNPGTIWIKFGH